MVTFSSVWGNSRSCKPDADGEWASGATEELLDTITINESGRNSYYQMSVHANRPCNDIEPLPQKSLFSHIANPSFCPPTPLQHPPRF